MVFDRFDTSPLHLDDMKSIDNGERIFRAFAEIRVCDGFCNGFNADGDCRMVNLHGMIGETLIGNHCRSISINAHFRYKQAVKVGVGKIYDIARNHIGIHTNLEFNHLIFSTLTLAALWRLVYRGAP